MLDLERILDTFSRLNTGPVVETFRWDSVVIPKAVKKYLKKYDLEKTCDPANPVNTNDELADRFFQAGMDMAVETGMLCTDTHRVLKYTHEEIRKCMKQAPRTFTLGEGKDLCHDYARTPDDKTPPHFSGPLSIQVTDDVFQPLQEGIARIPELDVIEGPSLTSIWGHEIRGGSPMEQLASKHQMELTTETLEKVGRPNLGRHCSANAPTHYGVIGTYGLINGYKPGRDIVLGMNPAEIKTSYDSLHRMIQVYNAGHDGRWMTGTYSYIGGSAGGPEGAVVCNIANSLLTVSALQPSNAVNGVYDVRYLGNTDAHAQWALGILQQALSRNVDFLIGCTVNSRAGPMTKMLLYENVVGMMNIVVSGASGTTGVRSAGGRFVNYLSPLEHDLAAKVYKASANLKREEANHIAQQLIPKYEKHLNDPPLGKPFTEIYDMKTVQPIKEWQRMHDEVYNEVKDLGIPLE